jgi:ribosomal protein S18 acetylase RimI-like enzyme
MAETIPPHPPVYQASDLIIRDAVAGDIPKIVQLDALNTDLPKPDYWDDTFARFGGHAGRYFLSAEEAGEGGFLGFIVGEVRAWEFGSPPCGWILTIGVMPEHRVRGVGALLFEAICERLRADDVTMVRTMLARDDHLNMSFFRAQGLMAGSFIELEKMID